MGDATSGIQLPSRLRSTATGPRLVLLSRPTEGRTLSWPEWLVTYQDGVRANGHPSEYNRARHGVVLLMQPLPLLRGQITDTKLVGKLLVGFCAIQMYITLNKTHCL